MEILTVSNAAATPSFTPFTSPRAYRKCVGNFPVKPKLQQHQQLEAKELILVFVQRFAQALVRQTKLSSKPAIVWLLAGLLSPLPGLSLNYDDILQSVKPTDANLDLNFEISGSVDSVLGFVSENPVAVLAGTLGIVLPLAVGSLLGQQQAWGTSTAREAYAKLGEEGVQTQLLDIRGPNDIKVEGSPNLRSLKKRSIQVVYSGDASDLIEKVFKKLNSPSSTTLYILDQFGGDAVAVAKLLAANGFKAAYGITGGAEGPNGWKKSELPWMLPRKGFDLNLEAFKGVFGSDDPSVVPASIGVAAAAGVGLIVFSEAETALQLLGTAALVQVFLRKLLFAEDRKKTLKEVQVFLDTKVAPKDLVEELKGVGKAFLPKFKVLPNDIGGNGAAISETPEAENPESQASDVTAPTSSEAAAPLASEATKVTKEMDVEYASSAVVIPSARSHSSQSLSPYPMYASLKPPTSPTPARP